MMEGKVNDCKCIYTFDNSGYIGYSLIKKSFNMSDEDIYDTISEDFNLLLRRLEMKGIVYDGLKGALIPNQDKDMYETCLIIDRTQVPSSGYGRFVFGELIPLMDDKSTYSILHGDYVDIMDGRKGIQKLLKDALEENLHRCNESIYQSSEQYYLIYINRLTKGQRDKIIEGLEKQRWFTGYIDTTYNSIFKSYIAGVLTNLGIKYKNKIIAPHPLDYEDEDNVNMLGYPFEQFGYQYVSINDTSFYPFLCYKIERGFSDKEDIGFAFNALFPKFDSMDKIHLEIKDEKWDKYLTNKDKGKGELLERLGFNNVDKKKFAELIYRKICSNYLYNLRKNEYGAYLFNVCAELETIHGNMRKTTIALKYLPDLGVIQVNTIT
jgi:hypothetical protein